MEQTQSASDAHDKLLQWQRVRSFPIIVWLVLIGTFLSRLTYFMAWPFLVVFLYREYGASEIFVGSILAVSALVGSVSGFGFGYVSDRIGRRRVMLGGCVLAMIGFAGLGLADSLWQFFILMILVGLMRPSVEQPGQALMSDYLENSRDRELAFYLRYFMVNAGGAIGPLIGIALALHHPQRLFLLTGASFVVYAIALKIGFHYCAKPAHTQQNSMTLKVHEVAAILRRDSLFASLILANLLMFFVYSQVESSLPQVIAHSGLAHAGEWVSYLILINTITIVSFQFMLISLLDKMPVHLRICSGVVLMGIAQFFFLASSTQWPWGWLIGAFILSLGETIVFPSLNVQLDRLAPTDLRGSYFGAATLGGLGFALGPFVGGMVLDHFNTTSLYIVCLAVIGVALWGYIRISMQLSSQKSRAS
ncbi:MAG: Na(+), Li(+), K(+)/H(+) antiporter [Candidatus Celerinatantimonas neptuna]|nr:MAG: Na(+), Li(+), K(+)/H(+) antiporter [Candidatus Celerinatantimonas neptuna]